MRKDKRAFSHSVQSLWSYNKKCPYHENVVVEWKNWKEENDGISSPFRTSSRREYLSRVERMINIRAEYNARYIPIRSAKVCTTLQPRESRNVEEIALTF